MTDRECSVEKCGDGKRIQRMCLKHYDAVRRAGSLNIIQPKKLPLHIRLEKQSQLNPVTACMEWTGGKNEKGYGLIGIRGVTRKAHRAVWEEVYGPIPRSMHVLHHCDNRACINIAHLFLGTHLDNMSDMKTKGRNAVFKGEDHGCAKLTEEQIREIRNDSRVHREIAKDYKVVKSLVSMIKRREIWKHVV